MAQQTNFEEWIKRSTKASGVPLKVTDRATIAALQVLVSVAQRARTVMARRTR